MPRPTTSPSAWAASAWPGPSGSRSRWAVSASSFAGEARLTQGYARSILAREASVDQGLVGTLITGRVTFERPTGVFLLVAGRVDGPVKAVLDWRGALAFGAAFGLFWAPAPTLSRGQAGPRGG